MYYDKFKLEPEKTTLGFTYETNKKPEQKTIVNKPKENLDVKNNVNIEKNVSVKSVSFIYMFYVYLFYMILYIIR